jgi:hypothetical protein
MFGNTSAPTSEVVDDSGVKTFTIGSGETALPVFEYTDGDGWLYTGGGFTQEFLTSSFGKAFNDLGLFESDGYYYGDRRDMSKI